MRTEQEVKKALRHVAEALAGFAPQDRETVEFFVGCKTYKILAWVLKREEGEEFAKVIAEMEDVDAAHGISREIQ